MVKIIPKIYYFGRIMTNTLVHYQYMGGVIIFLKFLSLLYTGVPS